MNHRISFVAALSLLATIGILPTATLAATEPVPCEKMLGDLRTAVGGAKLSDADNAKVADLQGKGIERCKADDDAGADAFFSDAMKIVGSK